MFKIIILIGYAQLELAHNTLEKEAQEKVELYQRALREQCLYIPKLEEAQICACQITMLMYPELFVNGVECPPYTPKPRV